MIEQYIDYLENLLKKSGIKERVCKTMKELQAYQGSHVGAVIVDFDQLTRLKKNKVYEAGEQKIKRVMVFNRITTINVVIGEHSAQKCDEIFVSFLSNIDRGMYDPDGNYIYIELGEADWVSGKDSILKSQIAVQLPITFQGGIYKDYVYKDVVPYIYVDENEV